MRRARSRALPLAGPMPYTLWWFKTFVLTVSQTLPLVRRESILAGPNHFICKVADFHPDPLVSVLSLVSGGVRICPAIVLLAGDFEPQFRMGRD